MAKPAAARIFISYSRKDGAAFAARLRGDLEAKGFGIWQDLVALEGGRDWWSQIEGALKSKALQHFILVVTPQALASPVVRREIRLARQEGKTFLPIKGPGLGDLNALPRWIGQLTDLDIPEHWVTLQRILEDESRVKRVPMMAPEPLADFVPRPREFDALKRQLIDAKGDAVGITAALRGAGGYGKSTLARALAHDPDIQDAYLDGVLWVELGEQGGQRVIPLINDLVALLTGASPQTTTLEAARTALAEALGDLRILLVVDDVWARAHLDPFLHGGRHTTRLATTRFDRELPETAVRQPVDAMQADEALALLAHELPQDQAKACGRELTDLARRLHEWAQLLKLANGFLRDRVLKFRQPLATAIAEAGERLTVRGLPAFDDPKAKDYEGRHKSVAAVIGLNLDLLDAECQARFGELGIFPEDVDVPVGIVARLWGATGGLDAFATLDLLSDLFDLLDPGWLKAKLAATASPLALVSDYEKFGHGQMQSLIGRTLRLTSGICTRDPRQLMPQLLGRLMGTAEPEAPAFLAAARGQVVPPVLLTEYPSLAPPGAEVTRLEGHDILVKALVMLPDGRLASADDDGSVRLWDIARGAETARLEGHDGWAGALAVLPDGRLASGGYDGVIRIWDTGRGTEVARLESREGWVKALAVLPDGRLASGGDDGVIRLWDTGRGTDTAHLEGHEDWVEALVVLSDGRLASGGRDGTVRLWDAAHSAEITRLRGHGVNVQALAVLPDGRLASGDAKGTIRLWDTGRGTETARLESHEVGALAVLPDGRLASGGHDGLIRLWDPECGAETARLEGHGAPVEALTVLPNGRLASGGYEGVIRLWDLARGAETTCLGGHVRWVEALAVISADRVASAGHDGTVRLWDPARGAEISRLNGNDESVRTLAVLTDGRLASGGTDGTVRLRDTRRGIETARLMGHSNGVEALAVLPDGRLASGGYDGNVRLWDLDRSVEIARLEDCGDEVEALAALPDGRLVAGHTNSSIQLWDPTHGAEAAKLEGYRDWVPALAVLLDGRLASGGGDGSIRLWDTVRGAETMCLKDHSGVVWALAVLPNGRLASGGDDRTIRLWDPARGVEVARLEVDGAVTCLAALPDGRLVAGDALGRLHWLVIAE